MKKTLRVERGETESKRTTFRFFLITHGGIFSSETLEWMIISLLSLISNETSKLQVCLDELALYDTLSHKLRCYTGISGPEKSCNNTREKISYFLRVLI